MNTVAPLKHEPNRKERLKKAIIDKDEVEAIRLIRDTGMKPSDFDKDSFIHYALRSRQIRVIEALIAGGANVNIKSKYQLEFPEAPLYLAVYFNYPEIVRALIAGGAQVNKRTYFGFTPICVAAEYGRNEMVEALIAAGADVNLNNTTSYYTPIYCAAVAKNYDIVAKLLAAGADVNGNRRCSRTPRSVAIFYGQWDIMKLLDEHGADPGPAPDPGPPYPNRRRVSPAGGRRKRTRKYRKPKRKTRSSKNR